jgi:hypothetical protein
MGTELISLHCVLDHLTPQDDPEAWKVILDVISEEFEEQYRADIHGKQPWFMRIGMCSHWWRPHQARWTQAGGFAWPVGYSGNGWPGPPEFDWSVVLSFDGEHWKPVEKFLRQQICRATSDDSGANCETQTGSRAYCVVEVSRTGLLRLPRNRRQLDLRCGI